MLAIKEQAANGMVETLTVRERDVLSLLEPGLSNRQMAEHRCVSENTIKFHLKNIFAKLDAGNRIGAINEARRQSLI